MKVTKAKPVWGETLNPGYLGFITREHDALAEGIEWFERWTAGLPFVHVFILSGPDEVVEAHAGGVRRASLAAEYFNEPDCQVFIREPRYWTPAMGASLVAEAEKHLGDHYGYGLILADMLANSFLGHSLNKFTFNLPNRAMSWLLNGRNDEICSELAALVMQTQYPLRLRGCLRQPAREITPKLLGNDELCFKTGAWRIA